MIRVVKLSRGICMIMILSAIYLLGCGSESQDLPLRVGESGRFYTQDINKAQKEIPFQIVVPSYLPANLPTLPDIVGVSQQTVSGSPGEGRSTLGLRYGAGNKNMEGLIEIHEWDFPVVPLDPNLNEGYVTILIREIEVVQVEHIKTQLASDGTIDHPGFVFSWNQNSVYFEARIYHYDYDEAVKIVASMIH